MVLHEVFHKAGPVRYQYTAKRVLCNQPSKCQTWYLKRGCLLHVIDLEIQSPVEPGLKATLNTVKPENEGHLIEHQPLNEDCLRKTLSKDSLSTKTFASTLGGACSQVPLYR